MQVEPEILQQMKPEIQNTPSLLEAYYRFFPRYDRLVGLSHAKIFNNLMMNDHNSRWFARNQLKNLRIILVTIVISINEKDFSTAE